MRPVQEVCLELEDHSVVRRSAVDFFQLRSRSDPASAAARLADQFVLQNRALLERMKIRIGRDYDGDDLHLLIESGSVVGAIPLLSPATARPDYGLVVQPRFPWAGIGPMLAQMGWRVAPQPLRLPLLRRSERRVPVWVLALMILSRLKALLDALDRRFELVSEDRQAPRGSIRWPEYAAGASRAKFLPVPCTYPDLRDDRQLKGAIRHALERQLRALETQRQQGAFVHQLIEFGQELMRRVQSATPLRPPPAAFAGWLRRPLRSLPFLEGVQAIEWTEEERGLAGMSDLEGIPWCMSMDQFFEAWIEAVFHIVARQTGAQMRTGRKRETVRPLIWEPPYLGSQKSLVPDLWLEWEGATVIVDAKYKRHWEELQRQPWVDVEKALQEQHRNDLLQVLAYANLTENPRVVVCLAYPCSSASWESLRERGRLIHRATVTAGARRVQLWLTAVPMAVQAGRVAEPLAEQVRGAVFQ